jgi:uncharacterized protein YaaW (UPF0174 family)
MYDAMFPEEFKHSLQARMETARLQTAADQKMCDGLAPQSRANNKTCILLDNPVDGWKIVQRMERQEKFLDAMPVIVSSLMGLLCLYLFWRGFRSPARRALAGAGRLLQVPANTQAKRLALVASPVFAVIALSIMAWEISALSYGNWAWGWESWKPTPIFIIFAVPAVLCPLFALTRFGDWCLRLGQWVREGR